MIGVPTYLRVIGVLLIFAALPAGWLGFEAMEGVQGLENEIEATEAQVGKRMSKEKADQDLAGTRRELDEKVLQRNLWFGAAGVGLALGVALALLPSSRQRKPPAKDVPPGPHEPAGQD